MKRAFWVAGLLLLVIAGAVQAQERANWTILHYTDVDNNLEGAAFNDYSEMQAAGSGGGVNIVTQFDRAEGYDSRFGDWTDTRRFFIQGVPSEPLTPELKQDLLLQYALAQGMDEATARDQIAAMDEATFNNLFNNLGLADRFDQTSVEDLGEVDMGDPQALYDFLVWGAQNYPADHYMVVIGSHGGGWRGIGPDDGGADPSMLTLPEIDAALGQARETLGIDQFDIVGFDACLMAVTDVAAMLQPHAKYVLFSQEVIPSQGWEYTNSINAMKDNPDWDAFQVGANFVDQYMAYYAGPGERTKLGLSLVDTAALPNLLGALQNFAGVVQADEVALLSALGTARSNSQVFGTSLGDRADYYSYIDLRDFMNWFSLQTSITDDAYNAAQEVIAAYDGAVVYSQADSKLPRATGLAVYLPSGPQVYAAYGEPYPASAPASMSFWQDYLNEFNNTVTTALDGSALQMNITSLFNIGDTASLVDPPVVFFDAAGQGVIDMSYVILYQGDDGSQTVVDASPISYNTTLPTGETILEYPNELTPSSFTWGVTFPYISDGTNAPLGLMQANGSESLVQGTYVDAQGNSLPAFLIFDSNSLEYQGTLAVSDGGPLQARPQPGDQFIVDLLTLDAEGNVVLQPLDSTPLTYGLSPFTVSYQMAPSGTYRAVLKIADLAGNSTSASADFAINNDGLDGTVRGYSDTNEGVYFQYPLAWGESYALTNDDGSLTNAVSSDDGSLAVYVDVYADTDAQTGLQNALAYAGVDVPVDAIEINGQPAFGAQYTFETDTGTNTAIAFSLANPDSGSAVVVTISGSADPASFQPVIDLVTSTVGLFAPVE